MNKPTNYAIGLAAACALATLYGCVSAEKIHQPHETLRDNIRKGEFVQPGDQLVVVTADQRELVFRVTEVDEDTIRGAQVEVPIDEVVALEVVGAEKPRSARMGTEVDPLGAVVAVVAIGATALRPLDYSACFCGGSASSVLERRETSSLEQSFECRRPIFHLSV